jgi:hypothetical protein
VKRVIVIFGFFALSTGAFAQTSPPPNWKKIEAENGEILKFDLNEHERNARVSGHADLTLYIDPTATAQVQAIVCAHIGKAIKR